MDKTMKQRTLDELINELNNTENLSQTELTAAQLCPLLEAEGKVIKQS